MTFNSTGAVAHTAPIGTNLRESDAWTTIGHITKVGFDREPDDTPFLAPSWQSRATRTVTIPIRAIRHLLPPPRACFDTRTAIEQHFLKQRIARLLLDARNSRPLLPCPLPY
ncbi:hypothetical protein [Streptomyces kronopolitis]|uniref:hypothetical protein n=1 Tax=Streptomyces kronopolitis TaxID=1612435 RepID=UPI003D96AEC8